MKHTTSIHPSSNARLPRTGLKAKLALAACAFLLTAAARAEVFIYRGLDHTIGDITVGQSTRPLVNIYVVTDYDQREFGFIVFYNLGTKKFFGANSPAPIDVATASLPKGKTATLLVESVTSQTGPGDFSHALILFRGTNATLTSRTLPLPSQTNRPRVLTSTVVVGFASASVGSFTEERIGVSLNPTLTIQANNANQSIQQALDALVQSLKAKGYVSL